MPFWSRQKQEGEDIGVVDQSKLPKHLPLPTGPYAVGYQDVMTQGDENEGVFVRLYYPSYYPVNETVRQHKHWPVWAEDEYLVGFVRFMQAMLQKWPSWAPRAEYMFIDQMAYIAPLMHIGCTHVWKLLNGVVHCPIIHNAPLSVDKKWPVIIFSHGMGCSRFAYSRICTDLASHGFLVAATEHRDGSSCLSFTMEGKNRHNQPTRNWIPHRKVGEDEKEYLVRNEQLKFRREEMLRTLNLVDDLANGKPVKNVLEPQHQGDLTIFKGQLDMNRTVASGHSFGGATTLMALVEDPRFKLGLVLDGWLFSMKEESLNPSQPILFINTESFMNRHNINRMRQFLGDTDLDRRMVFIKGSVHQNHIDAPLIFKSVAIKKIIGMHSETDAHTVLDVNNKLMIHFINSRLERDLDPDLVQFINLHDNLLIEAKDKVQEEDTLSDYESAKEELEA